MKTIYRYAVIAFIVGAIGLLFLDKIVMPLYVRADAGRFLPDVTGMSYEEAKSILELEGFPLRCSISHNLRIFMMIWDVLQD